MGWPKALTPPKKIRGAIKGAAKGVMGKALKLGGKAAMGFLNQATAGIGGGIVGDLVKAGASGASKASDAARSVANLSGSAGTDAVVASAPTAPQPKGFLASLLSIFGL